MALNSGSFHLLPSPQGELFELPLRRLQPTQFCLGLAEVRARANDFRLESIESRRRYLKSRPVPVAVSSAGEHWMIDRHHRLRALLDVDPSGTVFCAVVLELKGASRLHCLEELNRRGWLYLQDGQGNGPYAPEQLPQSLEAMQDDPYRSLVWKLKQEGLIKAQPAVPFLEFHWGAWLRRQALPPFSSSELDPALVQARLLVRSRAGSGIP
ncbi:chromosome partitioning protein ParB [Synechococcus sp. CS-602]|uniref:ParB-like protein n=1 Tax=Synechococcaceae TaxID=1890426 RepID=UPI0008FF4174|nr:MULTISPECIES: ParB-like protein [Synechococcaceae]MCT4363662.1 chromosome partitioning protein ParB [Candidatus Regnicoccus frigidus MAG-AL1]APD47326.1 chromosome partitioning protein ParB [Synechococcus sp. SynAce01]MCT0202776.1 chromosome partitioning protein ParB [Synechococcus sp. CS-603]MCT0203689.1 chromosome partitioning protein ParB [Synechococcus sp. CS-602]MCT0245314.1 chromosome partitioning protein ParB [Synechococcus sp. CS-601]